MQTSTVVGYQNTTLLKEGYNFIIPTFVNVADKTAEYDIQQVKLINCAGDGSEMIVGYDKDACLNDKYYFYYTEAGSSGEYTIEGWYDADDDSAPVKNLTMPLGTGLYLACYDTGVAVQYSGEVPTFHQTNDLYCAGYNMIGNSTPVTIDLQDIKLVGCSGDGSEMIVGYDKDACLSDKYYFYYTEAGSSGEYTIEGWYDADDDSAPVKGFRLAPGEGVYLCCYDDTVKFTLPDPMTYVLPDDE